MIIVDLETTGLDPERNSIASIGAVDFFNPSRTYYKECYVADETIISEESLKVTGFTVQSLRDRTKPSAQFLTKDFFNWCDIAAVKLLAGENPWLDASFLRVSSKRYGIRWPFGHRLVDLHSISYLHQISLGLPIPKEGQDEGLSLDRTLEYLGIRAERGLHNALIDARLEAEAFSRFIYGKPLFKEYEPFPVPEPLRRSTARAPETSVI